MIRMLFSIVGNAVALIATAFVVPGITFTGSWVQLLVAGAIFGLLNLIVRPIALILSLPALVLTLGLFYFVLNGLLLWGFSQFMPGYHVSGLWAGILGSLVIMVVNWFVHALFGGKGKK
jgi:putative membrane protein